MALRSSISSLSAPSAPRTAPMDDETNVVEGEVVTEAPRKTLNRYAGASRPAAERPEIPPAVAGRGRGRPRKALGDGASNEAEKPARKPRTPKAVVGGSPTELRANIRAVEQSFKELKEQMDTATAKFQPKIDALRAQHAELSATLAQALLK